MSITAPYPGQSEDDDLFSGPQKVVVEGQDLRLRYSFLGLGEQEIFDLRLTWISEVYI